MYTRTNFMKIKNQKKAQNVLYLLQSFLKMKYVSDGFLFYLGTQQQCSNWCHFDFLRYDSFCNLIVVYMTFTRQIKLQEARTNIHFLILEG